MIQIIGAGAIGGPIAALLFNAGRKVQVIDSDQSHVTAIRERGLEVTGAYHGQAMVPVYTPDQFDEACETVLLAVKAQAVPTVLDRIGPRLDSGGVVVPLQNGLSALQVAEVIGPARTLPASVSFAGHRTGPGKIFYGAAGAITLGEYDGRVTARVQEVAALLAPFGQVLVTDNPWGVIWAKLALATVYSASALDGRAMPTVLSDPECRSVLATLVGEVTSVARARGIRIESIKGIDVAALRGGTDASAAAWDRLLAAASAAAAAGKTHSGVYYDLVVHRRQSEAPYLLAPMLKLARGHAVPVPATKALLTAIREVETGSRPVSQGRVRELVRHLRT